jgi:hypothetical protein
MFSVSRPREDLDPARFLDFQKWEFYAVSTTVIDEESEDQKTVVLGRIRALTSPVGYTHVSEKGYTSHSLVGAERRGFAGPRRGSSGASATWRGAPARRYRRT